MLLHILDEETLLKVCIFAFRALCVCVEILYLTKRYIVKSAGVDVQMIYSNIYKNKIYQISYGECR